MLPPPPVVPPVVPPPLVVPPAPDAPTPAFGPAKLVCPGVHLPGQIHSACGRFDGRPRRGGARARARGGGMTHTRTAHTRRYDTHTHRTHTHHTHLDSWMHLSIEPHLAAPLDPRCGSGARAFCDLLLRPLEREASERRDIDMHRILVRSARRGSGAPIACRRVRIRTARPGRRTPAGFAIVEKPQLACAPQLADDRPPRLVRRAVDAAASSYSRFK